MPTHEGRQARGGPIISDQSTAAAAAEAVGDAAGDAGRASAPAPRQGSARRGVLLTAGLAVLGAVLVVVAVGRDWAHGTTVAATAPASIAVTGKTLTSAPYALALVGLAGALALLATRTVGRLLTAVVLLLVGVGAAVAVVGQLGDLRRGLTDKVAVRYVGHSDPVVNGVSGTVWPYVALVGAVLIAAAGVAAVWRGRRWPGMSGRYEAPAAAGTGNAVTGAGTAVAAATNSGGGTDVAGAAAGEPDPVTDEAPRDETVAARELWDALDRGEDPTR